jgi:hypothetical protein
VKPGIVQNILFYVITASFQDSEKLTNDKMKSTKFWAAYYTAMLCLEFLQNLALGNYTTLFS